MYKMEKRWEIKQTVINLRRKGLSYSEIRKQIPIAKSTVSSWCKNIELTSEQISRLDERYKAGTYLGCLRGAKSNQLRRAKEVEGIKAEAKFEIPPLSKDEFKIAGLMLYWAEGYKSRKVGVSNSDPELIRFMMRWFREVCKVPEHKFKVYIHLHSGQNEAERKKFWSKITALPLSRFGKSYIKKEGTGHRKNILYNGTASINICDKNLLHKILSWIEAVISFCPHSSIGRASDS